MSVEQKPLETTGLEVMIGRFFGFAGSMLTNLFPANDIQTRTAERTHSSLSAKAEQFKCSYCPVNYGDACFGSCEDALTEWEAAHEVQEPRTPDVVGWNITGVLTWMQHYRTKEVLIQCAYCGGFFDGLTPWSVHLLSCEPVECQVHHKLSSQCRELHVSAADSPSVEQNPTPVSDGLSETGVGTKTTYQRKADARIAAAREAHYAKQHMNGDYHCSCGRKFHFESDWLYHLGEMVADELAQ